MRAITLTWASPVLLGNNHLLFLTGGKREVALVKRTQPIKSSKWQVCSWLYQFLPQFLQVGWSLVKPTFLYGTIGIGIPSSQSYFNKDKGRSSNDLAWCISKLLLRNKVAQTQELKKKKVFIVAHKSMHELGILLLGQMWRVLAGLAHVSLLNWLMGWGLAVSDRLIDMPGGWLVGSWSYWKPLSHQQANLGLFTWQVPKKSSRGMPGFCNWRHVTPTTFCWPKQVIQEVEE